VRQGREEFVLDPAEPFGLGARGALALQRGLPLLLQAHPLRDVALHRDPVPQAPALVAQRADPPLDDVLGAVLAVVRRLAVERSPVDQVVPQPAQQLGAGPRSLQQPRRAADQLGGAVSGHRGECGIHVHDPRSRGVELGVGDDERVVRGLDRGTQPRGEQVRLDSLIVVLTFGLGRNHRRRRRRPLRDGRPAEALGAMADGRSPRRRPQGPRIATLARTRAGRRPRGPPATAPHGPGGFPEWRARAAGPILARMLLACCTLAALAATPVSSTPHGGWEPLAFESRMRVEIDRRRILRDDGFIDVWIRTRPQRDSVASEFEAAGAPPEQVERVRRALGHSEHLWSFRCEDETHALARSAYYATDGALIRAFDVSRREYWPIRPDTLGERLLDEVCGPAGDGRGRRRSARDRRLGEHAALTPAGAQRPA
jgi:hypothetical protein